jgi:hypothetical protein
MVPSNTPSRYGLAGNGPKINFTDLDVIREVDPRICAFFEGVGPD